jgi:hypothetical protein
MTIFAVTLFPLWQRTIIAAVVYAVLMILLRHWRPNAGNNHGASDETAKPDGKRSLLLAAVPYLVLTPPIYMGVYYATCAHSCGEADGHYMIGDAQLPYGFEVLFVPADYLEHWLELGPCRPVKIVDPERTWLPTQAPRQ